MKLGSRVRGICLSALRLLLCLRRFPPAHRRLPFGCINGKCHGGRGATPVIAAVAPVQEAAVPIKQRGSPFSRSGKLKRKVRTHNEEQAWGRRL